MKPSTRFWDWVARRYDKYSREDEALARRVETIARYLKPEDIVLDYACGPGVVTCKVASVVTEAHGIDISGGMIDLARQNARDYGVTNVCFLQKTIIDAALERESYDLILALNIFHLVDDARKAIRRAAELLKPDGLLISIIPCLGDANLLVRSLLPMIKVVISSHLRPFRISEVRDLICTERFQIMEFESPKRFLKICYVVARKDNSN